MFVRNGSTLLQKMLLQKTLQKIGSALLLALFVLLTHAPVAQNVIGYSTAPAASAQANAKQEAAEIRIIVRAAVAIDEVTAAIESRGGTVISTLPHTNSVVATLPADQLEALEADERVLRVTSGTGPSMQSEPDSVPSAPVLADIPTMVVENDAHMVMVNPRNLYEHHIFLPTVVDVTR